MSKKRAFVRYTKSGEIVPGSLIITTNGGYPDKSSIWKEIQTNECCDGGSGGCNNCTPGTVTLLSNIPISNLEFPSLYGIRLRFIIRKLGCPEFSYESGSAISYIDIAGEVFNPQDVVDLINNSEIGQNYGITASIIDFPGEGLTFQLSIDSCSCLGINLSGGNVTLEIVPIQPALPNPNN